ncbi:MAG: class III poly(R)-hydroxyalkanoic acid synthase subunit PhaC [Motiliproteus sp.]
MKPPLTATAQQLAEELTDLNSRLVDSLQTLSQLPPVDVGTASHQCIYREDKLRLNFYPATSNQAGTAQRPLLIVYALINRPYILDLQPDRSLIRALNQRGIPVYLIDWGYPDSADCYLDLDDYINGYIGNCVEAACQHSDYDALNLLGVCQGGAFSLCYSALQPARVNNLITLVTPVDFHTPDNLLSHLSRKLDVEQALGNNGNLPGKFLVQAFNSLMPMRLGLQKSLNLPQQLKSSEQAMNFLRMEQWINDSPDLAGEACREFIDKFYHSNRFIEGQLEIGDQAVELKNYQGPLLNIFAARDHLVPPAASKALAAITGSQDYTEQEFSGGHIGVFVGRHAQQQLPDLIRDWLGARP